MNRKNTRIKAIILGVVIGIFMVVVENVFNIPRDVMRKAYFILGAVAIVGSVAINILWQKNFQKKVQALMPILYEENNPDLFIEENKKLLENMRSPYNKAFLLLNISVGYSDKRDYQKAKEILLQIPENAIRGLNGIIYYIDLVYYNFKLMNMDEVIAIMDKHEKEFKAFENHKTIGKHIKLNQIFYLRAKNELEEADKLISILEKESTDKRLLGDLEELKKGQ